MSRANAIMLGVGALALVGGGATLVSSFRVVDERARYARRIGGMMGFALGLALTIFSVGLDNA